MTLDLEVHLISTTPSAVTVHATTHNSPLSSDPVLKYRPTHKYGKSGNPTEKELMPGGTEANSQQPFQKQTKMEVS